MSKTRKYENYKVVVTYDNGDKEEINYNGINTSSYKEMLKIYNDTKEQYSDKCVVIDFAGVGENGELNILWTKEIKNEEHLIEEESYKNKNSIELIKDIETIVNKLEENNKNIHSKLGTIEKEQDIQLHKIESFERGNFKDEQETITEKLKIFNELERIRKERRNTKNEIKLLDTFFGKLKINEIKDKLGSVTNSYDKLIDKNNKVKYLSDDKIEELKIMKKIKYKTERERISLISQFKPKYDKVYYENGEVVCYNYGYGRKVAK